MKGIGIQLNQYTFSSILLACENLAVLEKVHKKIIKSGMDWDMLMEISHVDMYAKFRKLEDAHKVFERMPQ